MKQTEVEYWQSKKIGSNKKYILNVNNFREVLYDYQPSTIWFDEFSEEIPYISGHYADSKFNGCYTKQTLLTFDLDSLSQLESIFKNEMYIFV